MKEEILKEVTTIISDKMTQFESKQNKKLDEMTKMISTTVSEGIMNVVTKQMEEKFDGYMCKILKAVEKDSDKPNPVQPQHAQPQYYTTQPGYLNPITPQNQAPSPLAQTPLRFADPRFAYTPLPNQHIMSSLNEVGQGPN